MSDSAKDSPSPSPSSAALSVEQKNDNDHGAELAAAPTIPDVAESVPASRWKLPESAESHLAVESPQFERGNRPHIWIQWKGTDVCCDIHCLCGAHCHHDGDFFYEFQCPHCLRYWEVGTHVQLYEVTKAHFEKRGCAQVVTPDDEMPVSPEFGK